MPKFNLSNDDFEYLSKEKNFALDFNDIYLSNLSQLKANLIFSEELVTVLLGHISELNNNKILDDFTSLYFSYYEEDGVDFYSAEFLDDYSFNFEYGYDQLNSYYYKEKEGDFIGSHYYSIEEICEIGKIYLSEKLNSYNWEKISGAESELDIIYKNIFGKSEDNEEIDDEEIDDEEIDEDNIYNFDFNSK